MPDSSAASAPASSSPTSLDALLSPVGSDAFFTEYRHRKPLHISGGVDRFADLMGWEILSRLLSQTTIWSATSLMMVMDGRKLDPPEYCTRMPARDGGENWRPESGLVTRWLARGATIVANDIDQLTPEMSRLSSLVERSLEAKVQMNLYCSSQAHQGFGPHYDKHEVFALHIAGEKTWRLYEMSREDHPINHDSFYRSPEWHAANCGELTAEITLKPGDLLYVPRGWYHEALATEGTVIHIAVGVTAPIGLDVLQVLTGAAVSDPLFRTDLPLSGDADHFAERIGALGERLADLAKNPKVIEAIAAHCRDFGWPRNGVSVPQAMKMRYWRVTGAGVTVVRIGADWVLQKGNLKVPIPPGWEGACSWILSRSEFSEDAFAAALPELSGPAGTDLLDKMAGMKLIHRD